jgi:hypothetical protein
MIRRLVFAGCTLAALLMIAAPARAQFGGRNMRMPTSMITMMMLSSDAVQKELDVNDEQKAQLADLALQARSEFMEIFSGLQDLNEKEREEAMPEVMKMLGEKGKEMQGKVDKILSEGQVTRLKQLAIQRLGALAFENEEVVATLKLTDEQKKQLTSIKEEGEKRSQEIRGASTDQSERQSKMAAMLKELGDKAMAVLNAEQKAAFEKLKGAKFDFPPQRGPF